jgi:hypothetical protein
LLGFILDEVDEPMKMEKVSLDSRNDAVNWQRFDGNLMACRARQKDWKLNCHDNIMDSRFSYLFYRPKLYNIYIYILFFVNSVLKHVKTWHLTSVEAISPKPSCLFWPIIHRRERFWPWKWCHFYGCAVKTCPLLHFLDFTCQAVTATTERMWWSSS